MRKNFTVLLSIFLLCTLNHAVTQENDKSLNQTDAIDYEIVPNLKLCDLTEYGTIEQCQNEGECLRNETTGEERCRCKPEYSGALCEIPRCLNYCYNDGKCKLSDRIDGQNICICGPRFYGARCEFDKCFKKIDTCKPSCFIDPKTCACKCDEECDYNYCNRRNGTCFDNHGDLECKCRVGYSGPRCLIDECKGYCFNGGVCVRTDSSIKCNCPQGFKSDKRCGVRDLTEQDKMRLRQMQLAEVPLEFRSTRIIMYALSMSLIVCLIFVAGYVAIQRGFFSLFFKQFDPKLVEDSPSTSFTRTSNFAYNKVNFNRLHEDEESIARNPENI